MRYPTLSRVPGGHFHHLTQGYPLSRMELVLLSYDWVRFPCGKRIVYLRLGIRRVPNEFRSSTVLVGSFPVEVDFLSLSCVCFGSLLFGGEMEKARQIEGSVLALAYAPDLIPFRGVHRGCFPHVLFCGIPRCGFACLFRPWGDGFPRPRAFLRGGSMTCIRCNGSGVVSGDSCHSCEAGGRHLWRSVHVRKANTFLSMSFLCYVQGLAMLLLLDLFSIMFSIPIFVFLCFHFLLASWDDYALRDDPPALWLSTFGPRGVANDSGASRGGFDFPGEGVEPK